MPNGEKRSSDWPEALVMIVTVLAIAAMIIVAVLVNGHV
jgi:hypothetical protein